MTAPRPIRAARNARWTVSTVFFVNGATIGSWAAHIPLVQERLQLSHSTLGVVLLAMAAGALMSMPVAGGISARRGSAATTRVTTVLFCASIVLPVLAPTAVTLAIGLFVFGALNGAMDVSMNAHAVTVEEELGKPVMSSFHGMFSLGGLVGAGFAALLITRVSAPTHAFTVAVLCLLAGGLSLRHLLPVSADAKSGGAVFAAPTKATLVLGVVGFLALGSEGAVLDWSALHLRSGFDVGPSYAALGFAAFSAAMALGRFGGDWLRHLTDAVTVVAVSALIAAAGLALALVANWAPAAVAGFALVGFGMANLVPVIFTAAGRLPGQAPGAGIAAVATMGYTGFLVGPPVIGFVAEATDLGKALWLVVLGCLAVACMAGAVRDRRP